jgi:hypothetical protein
LKSDARKSNAPGPWLRRLAWLLALWAGGLAAFAAAAWLLRTLVRGIMPP